MKKKAIMYNLVVFSLCLFTAFVSNASAKSKAPIKIAYIASITGPMGPKIRQMTYGVKLAIKEINDAGGILGGRKVQLITYDPRQVPEQAVTDVRKAIYADKVKAIIGFADTSLAMAAEPIALEAGVPTVNLMAMPDLKRTPNQLGFTSTAEKTEQLAAAQCQFAENQLKIKSLVVLGPENAWLDYNFKCIRDFFARPGSKVKVLATLSYPIGATDISPVILKAVGYKPDMIWSFAWGVTDTIQVYKQLAGVGYKGKIMQCLGMFIPSVIKACGETMNGAYSIIPWGVEINNPASNAFKKALVTAFGPQVLQQTSDVTANGYIGTKALLMAMNKAGSTKDLPAINKAYSEQNWITPMGYKFKLGKDGWLVWKEFSISQMKNGKVHIVAVIRNPS